MMAQCQRIVLNEHPDKKCLDPFAPNLIFFPLFWKKYGSGHWEHKKCTLLKIIKRTHSEQIHVYSFTVKARQYQNASNNEKCMSCARDNLTTGFTSVLQWLWNYFPVMNSWFILMLLRVNTWIFHMNYQGSKNKNYAWHLHEFKWDEVHFDLIDQFIDWSIDSYWLGHLHTFNIFSFKILCNERTCAHANLPMPLWSKVEHLAWSDMVVQDSIRFMYTYFTEPHSRNIFIHSSWKYRYLN